MSGGFWTDEDLIELTRLTKKYPNGTLSRWEVIAEHMNRSVQEVTFQAARLKEPTHRPTSDSVAENIVQEATKKGKKIAANIAEDKSSSEVGWSQEEQKLLESAIVNYPKTTAGDRWQKIANSVPGRTKEECLARYKYLVQKVKEQKLKEAAAQQQQHQEMDEQIEKVEESRSINDKIENIHDQDAVTHPIDEYEPELVPEPVISEKKTGGKPRNRRKQRKKQMEFSSDEDDHYDYE